MRTQRQVRKKLSELGDLIDRYNTAINTSRTRVEAEQWEIGKERVLAMRDVLRWVLKEVD